MNNIAILTPSRARPGRLDTMIKSAFATATNPQRIRAYNWIDADDPRYDAYKEYQKIQHNVNYTYGPPQSVSKSWNAMAQQAVEDGAQILMMGNDDLVYRTNGWDVEIDRTHAAVPDHIYCLWFNDLINGDKHCAFPIISREWYQTIGYTYEGFNFGYNDTWIFDIAKRAQRTAYKNQIVVEHMHFTAQKSNYDDTYAKNRTQEAGNLYDKDKIIFEETAPLREALALKLYQRIMKEAGYGTPQDDKNNP